MLRLAFEVKQTHCVAKIPKCQIEMEHLDEILLVFKKRLAIMEGYDIILVFATWLVVTLQENGHVFYKGRARTT